MKTKKKKKKKLAVQNKASNNSVTNYLSTKNISEMEKQLSLAAQEATFAYHTTVHNHSFKSIDCTTAILFFTFFIVFHFLTKCPGFLGGKCKCPIFKKYYGNPIIYVFSYVKCCHIQIND
jgi:hypothetical protein